MARTSGSDELFKLIHSLTVNEKGYFKKFALRHTSEGNQYLQLFEAINKQTAFEEKLLRKKFKAYSSMKMYLKEMITDSLLLYYRHQHPHIDLLSQIQKVHVLVMKGLQDEALKMLDKAIKQTAQMELFEQTRYLLRLRMNLLQKTHASSQSFAQAAKEYAEDMREPNELENDLMQWELRSLNALPLIKRSDVFNPESFAAHIRTVNETGFRSQRSKILKEETLFGLYNAEVNQQELLHAAEQYSGTVEAFKQKSDSAYNDVPAINNYLLTLSNYSKFKQVIALCDKVLGQPRYNQSHYQQLLVRCVIYKTTALIHLGKFEQALALVNEKETQFYSAASFTRDSTRQGVFEQDKVMALFLNKQYRETWLAIQDIHLKTTLRRFTIDYADLKMLELMTQFMLGNFELVNSMALKAKREFLKNKIQSHTYDILLNFFIKASPFGYKSEAKKSLQQLIEYYTNGKKFHRKAFARIRYSYWLEEISGGRTIRQSLQEQFGGID